MIQNTEHGEVVTLGDVQKYKVGIDEKNLSHIVTLLSSNLYSYPLQSFLRETVSNAVDSHTEAGVKEPIIIRISENTISIRDFGTGISPERFHEIYINIGSSTKRDSNDFIGHFGLGRFSCLSISDLANITSFYNGKAYYYVMNKDVDQLHIDLLYEKDTDEPNGVEVKVPVKNIEFRSLACLAFIDNIFLVNEASTVAYKTRIDAFNARKIYKYNNFKVTDYDNVDPGCKALVGNIPYSINYESLWDSSDYNVYKKYMEWKGALEHIYPILDIGSVDITPNREALLYSERTNEALRTVYNNCIVELTELWEQQCKTEFDDFKTWYLKATRHFDNRLKLEDVTITLPRSLPFNAILKGHADWSDIPYDDRRFYLSRLGSVAMPVIRVYTNGVLRKEGYRTSITFRNLLDSWLGIDNKQVMAVPNGTGMSSSYFRSYLDDVYYGKDAAFISSKGFNKLKMRIEDIFTIDNDFKFKGNASKFVFELLREATNYTKANIPYLDIINSPEYIKYKKDNSLGTSRVDKEKVVATFCLTNDNYSTYYKDTVTWKELKERIKNFRGKVVYSELDNMFIQQFAEIRYPKLMIVSVAKNKMNILKNLMPERMQHIDTLVTPDNRVLQRYAVAKYIRENYGDKLNTTDSDIFPEDVKRKVEMLDDLMHIHYYDLGSRILTNPLIAIVPPEKLEPKYMALFNETKEWMQTAKLLSSSQVSGLGIYCLIKAKKLRPSFKCYRNVKETYNKLIGIL